MAESFKLDITGDKELIRRFKELPAKLERKVLRQAMRAGANVILPEIRRNTPKDTGLGKKEVAVRAAKRMKRGNVGVVITTGDAWYLRLIEHGWMKAPTIIVNGRFVSLGKKSLKRALKGLMPTYMPPRPFMRPAFEGTKEHAARKAEQVLRDGVEREAQSD